MGILQVGLLEWAAMPSPPGDLPNPRIEPRSPALQVDSLLSEPPGKPKNTGVGSLSLLQGIFPTENQARVFCTAGGFSPQVLDSHRTMRTRGTNVCPSECFSLDAVVLCTHTENTSLKSDILIETTEINCLYKLQHLINVLGIVPGNAFAFQVNPNQSTIIHR